MRSQQLPLYLLVLTLAAFTVITALGGGIFNQQEHWFFQWQHQLFSGLCHQDPERSFWIYEQPMAVCSRCFGIYASFWSGWLLLPLLSQYNLFSFFGERKMLLGIIFLNMIDISGNMLEIWHNTLYSRLVMGGFLGWAVSQLFTGDFFIDN